MDSRPEQLTQAVDVTGLAVSDARILDCPAADRGILPWSDRRAVLIRDSKRSVTR